MAERWLVDDEPSQRYPIYTRANVGEVFPDPVAPMSATMVITPYAEPGWRDALVRFGIFDYDEFDADNNETIAILGGYCYLNVSITRIMGVRLPGLTPRSSSSCSSRAARCSWKSHRPRRWPTWTSSPPPKR